MALTIPEFALSEDTANYCVALASRVCSGVTKERYYRYIRWVYGNNSGKWNPYHFAETLSKLSSDELRGRLHPWHMEVINGKKVRVEDSYELITAPTLNGK